MDTPEYETYGTGAQAGARRAAVEFGTRVNHMRQQADEQEAADLAAAEVASKAESFGAGFRSESLAFNLADSLMASEPVAVDPPSDWAGWFTPQEDGTNPLEGVPRDMYRQFVGKDYAQGAALKEKIAAEIASTEAGAENIGSYMLGAMAGALASPDTVYAVSKIRNIVSVAQTVKRLHSAGTMTKVAAVGGVHNVGRESVLLNTQATRTKEEAAFNIGAGILADYALGGLSAGLSAGNRAALDAAVRRSVDMDTAGNPARVGELLNQEILDTPRHAGAAQATADAPGEGTGAEVLRGKGLFRAAGLDKAVMATMKFTPTGRLLLSDNPETRKLAQELVEVNVQVGGSGYIPAAVETAIKRYESRAAGTLNEIFNTTLPRVVKSGRMTAEEFKARLDEHLNFPLSSGEADPDILGAANRIADEKAALWNEAFEQGLPGTYRMEIGDDGKLQRVRHAVDAEGYETQVWNSRAVRSDPVRFRAALRDQMEKQDAADADAVRAEQRAYAVEQERLLREAEELTGETGLADAHADALRQVDAEADELRRMAFDTDDLHEAERLLSRARELEAARPNDFRRTLVRAAEAKRTAAKQADEAGKAADAVRLRQAADHLDQSAARLAVLRDKWAAAAHKAPRVKSEADWQDLLDRTYQNIARTGFAVDAPGGAGAASRGRFKQRMRIDRRAMGEWLEHDPEASHRNYMRGVGARVSVARQFGDVEMTEVLEGVRDSYRLRLRELDASGADAKTLARDRRALEKQREREINDIEKLRDMLLGRGVAPSAMQPENLAALTVLRTLRHLNVMTKMGKVLISNIPDIGRVMAYSRATKVAVAISKNMGTLRLSKVPKNDAARVARSIEAFAPSRVNNILDIGDDMQPAVSRAEAGAAWASQKFMMLSGLRHHNAFWKGVVGVLADDRIAEAVLRGVNTKELRRLGIDEAMEQRMKAQMVRLGGADTLFDGTVYTTRMAEWDDPDALRALEMAIIKEADGVVTTPGVGDKMLIANTELGKSIFQFKTFMLSTVNKIVMPSLQSDGARAYREFLYMVGLGALSYQMANIASGRELDRDPKSIARNAIDRTGLLSYAGELYNVQAKVTGVDPLGESARYRNVSQLGAWMGPSFGTAENLLFKTLNFGTNPDTGKPLVSPDARARALRLLIPANNHAALSRVFDEVERQGAIAMGGHGKRYTGARNATPYTVK